MRALLVSALLLIPCVWQTHIQAGDLPGHMYNVWLAKLIEGGHLPGLFLQPIFSNVLFDLWASFLVDLAGYQWGERLVVSTCVLTFFWGSWHWIKAMTGVNPWAAVPMLAMFSYGCAFLYGFMNFYWSLGICFWGLAFAESPSRLKRLLWWPLLILASVAHMLPVGWAAGLWVYSQFMRRLPSASRRWLLLAGSVGVVLFIAFIRWRYKTVWVPEQILGMLGVDQFVLIWPWYLIFPVSFLAIWSLSLLWTLESVQLGELVDKLAIHALVLTAIGVYLTPWVIHFPFFSSPLSYITHRMSLVPGVIMLSILVMSQKPRRVLLVTTPIAILYFFMVYRDSAPLDEFENKLHAAVRTVPAGVRVSAVYWRDPARVFQYSHIVDRACIGHCFSYASYEAATTQFRVRTSGPNPYVASDTKTSIAFQLAEHTITDQESPVYYFKWIPAEKRFVLRVLKTGDTFED